jgi:protein transport protein SEC20
VLTGLLGSSKQLVTALEKADWLDRLLIFAALIFFALIVLFILKQRLVDRGLRIAFWWTRFLPSLDRGVVMEKAAAPTDSVATIASSVVVSVTTALASQVPQLAGSSGYPLSTSVPHGQHDISDVLPHETADLGVVGSGLSPTLATSLTSATPDLESIHDEL